MGSNDLENTTPEEVGHQVRDLVLTTQRINPGCNIVLNELLPRFYQSLHATREYETKRTKFNSILHNLINDFGIKVISHPNITHIHFIDGIHLNTDCGISLYIRNMKEVVNPLIGIKGDNYNNKFVNDKHQRQNIHIYRERDRTTISVKGFRILIIAHKIVDITKMKVNSHMTITTSI